MKGIPLLLGLCFLLAFTGVAGATTVECDSCSSCDTAIAGASNGDIIQLNKSIVATSADCLSGFVTDNITVDCQGFSILSDPGSGNNRFAIWSNAGNDFIKIKNCMIGNSTDGFTAGVFMSFSTGSIIEDSVMQKVNTGILFSSSGESNNTVDNVTIEADSTGIIFFGDEKFNIVNNSIISSKGLENTAQVGATPSAIFFTGGGETENTFYNNIFNASTSWANAANQSENANTTKSNTTNIIGGTQIGGNFWAAPDGTGYSQTCDNLDNDSFCDSPYDLGDGNFDFLPLTNNYSEEPVAVLNIDWESPTNGSTVNTNFITWTVNLSEAPVECLLSINGSANVTMSILGSKCTYNSTGLLSGQTLCGVVSAADEDESNVSTEQCATTLFNINVSFIPPTPPNATLQNKNYLTANVSTNSTVSTCTLTVDSTNYSMTIAAGNLSAFRNVTGLSAGTHTYFATCDDFQSQTRTLNIDLTAPVVTIYSPQSRNYVAQNTATIPLQVAANKNISLWRYSLNGGTNTTFSPNTTISAASGSNTLIVYATDLAGNVGQNSVTFTVQFTGLASLLPAPWGTVVGIVLGAGLLLFILATLIGGGAEVLIDPKNLIAIMVGIVMVAIFIAGIV